MARRRLPMADALCSIVLWTLWQRLAARVPLKVFLQVVENCRSARPGAVFVEVQNAKAPGADPVNEATRVVNLPPAIPLKQLAIFSRSRLALLGPPLKLGALANEAVVLIGRSNSTNNAPKLTPNSPHIGIVVNTRPPFGPRRQHTQSLDAESYKEIIKTVSSRKEFANSRNLPRNSQKNHMDNGALRYPYSFQRPLQP